MATEAPLPGLIRRWQEALDRGQVSSAEQLCRDYPELVGQLNQELTTREPLLLPFPSPGRVPDGSRASDLEAGAEPVPGYRLEARVGGGGVGEVWKALGPGGFPVALKFLPLGEDDGAVAPRSAGAGEWRSLELMRAIRHAHLLPLFGAWRCGGRLAVGMELADRTLLDRCEEAARPGMPGIPFPELVEYLRQAAQAIDFLNEPRHALAGGEPVGILHCDIKPQNLLLVGDTVKVGDFGLARPSGSSADDLGGLTPAYAAPEFFQNRLSRRSDQYALALTYCRLRGGRLPFNGTGWEIILKHCLDAPDLSMLPAGERAVVARALAKRPEDRWANCTVFVRELKERGGCARRQPAQPFFLPLPPPARTRRRWWAVLRGALGFRAGSP